LFISVTDTGIGIPEDRRDIIFEPFRQADISTTRKYGGTGLGLSISKNISKLLNGNLYFKSEPSGGTTFTFEIPYSPIEESVVSPEDKDQVVKGKKFRDFSFLKVVVAEDNLVNQKVIVQMLKRYGVIPTLVDDGEKVLEHLAQGNKVDLIFMDCQMPVMSGYESTREIRIKESDSNKRVIIVAMTANALDGDRELCLDCGMDDYISKPVRSAELESILNKWVDSYILNGDH